jgi:histidinol phosphatase-like enzyme
LSLCPEYWKHWPDGTSNLNSSENGLGNRTKSSRKPSIGMALQAQRDFPDIDFSRSLMIGDSESDRQFANMQVSKDY